MKQKASGGNNPSARKVEIYDPDGNLFMKFDTVKEMAFGDWKNSFPKPRSSVHIQKCLKENLDFHGYKIIRR